MKRFLMITAVTIGLASTAAAEGLYISTKLGVFESTDSSKGVSDFRAGFSGELALGWKMHPNFALETGVGYGDAANSRFSVSTIPILLTARGILPLVDNKLELFLGGGGGYYFASGGGGAGIGSKDANGFGYHVTAGLDYRFTDGFSLGIELKKNVIEVELPERKRDVGGTTYALVGRFQL